MGGKATTPAADARPGAGARWEPRPRAALLVKVAIVAVPLVVGVGAAGLMSWLVPRPAGGLLVPLWWVGALGASVLARRESLVWFPEGGRSSTAELGRFLPGDAVTIPCALGLVFTSYSGEACRPPPRQEWPQ